MNQLLLVTDAWEPQVNGVVTTLQQMVKRAGEHGFEVTVIHPGLFKTVATPSYPEIRLAWNLWALKGALPSRVDSVHIATEGPLGLAARWLCHRRGWAYTTGYHTNFSEYLALRLKLPPATFHGLMRYAHKKSRAVFTPSRATADKLYYNLKLDNVIVWGRGYDEAVFRPGEPRARGDQLSLLYVGRVSVEKNLKALLTLADDPAYKINIVGDGPARQQLEREHPGAIFHGYKHGAALAEHYQAADVFVFPSLTDTFGIVMIEAMACGAPTAAFPVEGPKEALKHGGGVMHENLLVAIHEAAKLERRAVLAAARQHTWQASAQTFFSNLVDITGCRFTAYREALVNRGALRLLK